MAGYHYNEVRAAEQAVLPAGDGLVTSAESALDAFPFEQ
jgi:hypothetical protein